jgi:putative copper export protein
MLSVQAFLAWLEHTPFSMVMRESTWAEPIVETIHVLTLTVFLGLVLLLDLRLLDLALKRHPVSRIFAQFNPYVFAAFGVMVVTGLLLFCGDPVAFYGTIFFKAKMILLALAGLNVLLFNATLGKRMSEWEQLSRTPPRVRLSGAVSLVLWILIVAAGRGIAYVLPPP